MVSYQHRQTMIIIFCIVIVLGCSHFYYDASAAPAFFPLPLLRVLLGWLAARSLGIWTGHVAPDQWLFQARAKP